MQTPVDVGTIRRAMTSALGILCYHRLVDDDDVEAAWPYIERGTAVRMSTFLAQLEGVAGFADVISEHTALDALANRRQLERSAIWVTFDDGYRDVLRAIPHLETATLFVTTCVPQRTLPADAWYAVLLSATRLRGELDLGLGPFTYDLRHRAGRARLVNGPERRVYLRANAASQGATLRDLAEQLDAPIEELRCYLSHEEMRAALKIGWSLGCHGATHAPFDGLPPDDLTQEARQSRAILSALGGHVRSLAFPDGAVPGDLTTVLQAGYECLLGLGNELAVPGAVISRFIVPDDPEWVGKTLLPRFS